MKQITRIVLQGEWAAGSEVDFVELDAEDRHRRRVVLVGAHGATYLLNLPRPRQLRDGDALVLEDGAVVRVTGKVEPLVEITAASPSALARIAWHIGNRHTDVQVMEDALRIRRDHVLEEMLRGLDAFLEPLDAPFDPEPGAYAGHGSGHAHE